LECLPADKEKLEQTAKKDADSPGMCVACHHLPLELDTRREALTDKHTSWEGRKEKALVLMFSLKTAMSLTEKSVFVEVP